ncbi:hypothetical protein RV18_GL003905 [Enterococcus termitis]|nr:hypothetical protein RV18_GL003905 [Enterococcus termitis]
MNILEKQTTIDSSNKFILSKKQRISLGFTKIKIYFILKSTKTIA